MRILLAVIALAFVVESADAQKIRLRRMTEAAKDTLTYHTVTVGEPVYCTDSKKLYVWGSDSTFYVVGPDTVLASGDTINVPAIHNASGVLAIPDSVNVTGDVKPTAANTYDLGSSALPFDTAYVRGIARAGDDASQNFFQVQDIVGLTHTAASGTTGFTQTKNDTIYVWARYLPAPIKLGKMVFYTGALTGTSPVRTVSVAVYNASKSLVDSGGPAQYVASNAFPISFTNGATVGPGWTYFAFSVYFSTTGTFKFNTATVDINYGGAAIFLGQSTDHPIISRASEALSAGAGWPATLTLTRMTSVFQFPIMLVWGSGID